MEKNEVLELLKGRSRKYIYYQLSFRMFLELCKKGKKEGPEISYKEMAEAIGITDQELEALFIGEIVFSSKKVGIIEKVMAFFEITGEKVVAMIKMDIEDDELAEKFKEESDKIEKEFDNIRLTLPGSYQPSNGPPFNPELRSKPVEEDSSTDYYPEDLTEEKFFLLLQKIGKKFTGPQEPLNQ